MTGLKSIGCAVAATILSAGLAGAAAVTFEGTFEITQVIGLNTAGLTAGDDVVFTIIVDNGGGLAANSWSNSDVVSATAASDAYVATFNAPYFPIDPIFSTSLAGSIAAASWFDNDANNTDTAGSGSPMTLGSGLQAGDGTTYVFQTRGINDPSKWTATVVTAVPLPAGLPLLLAGLGGLALLRRRSRRT